MLRSRFILTAVVAVAAALAAPATSQAAFSVTLSTTDGPASVTIGDGAVAAPATGGFGDLSGASNQIRIDSNSIFGNTASPAAQTYNGLAIAVSATTNQPGTPSLGQVMDTELTVTNSTAAAKNIRIAVTATGFLFPGGINFLQTIITNLGIPASSLNNPNLIYSVVGATETDPGSFALDSTPGSPTQGSWLSDKPIFTNPGSYDVTLIVDLTVGAGETLTMQLRADVTPTPAPAGLVMLAGALLFVGLLRIRRRLAKTDAVTAA